MVDERMQLWNVKDLDRPPLLRCRSSLTQIDLDLLMNALRDGIGYYSNQQYLHREAALLSRLIYRMKMKFRSSKDFKILEKINCALLNYLQMDVLQMLKQFSSSVSTKSKTIGTFLPTRNMFDYILIRLQGLGKLLIRIIDCCKIACELHMQRMHLGHFWKIAAVIYGISSRIFIISKNMIKFTCNLYTKLYSLRSKFSNVGVKWLPNDYVQPKSLNEWLGISWEELERTVVIEIPDEPLKITSYFNLIDDDSDDDDDDIKICDEYVLIKDDTILDGIDDEKNTNVDNVENENITTLRGFDDNVDVGEVFILSDTDNDDLVLYKTNTNGEFDNNNSRMEENKEMPQHSDSVSQQNHTNTTPKTNKKRVVKIIKRKKSLNKTEPIINLDDSNEDNDGVIFVGAIKPIENNSNGTGSPKKKSKKRKICTNSIQIESKKIETVVQKFETNQQANLTGKKTKKRAKTRLRKKKNKIKQIDQNV